MEAILLIGIVGLAIFFLWGRQGSSASRRMAPHHAAPQEARRDELYRQLLNQVLGDREKAQRLIAFEGSKDPRLTEEQCIERASTIIEKDIKRWD